MSQLTAKIRLAGCAVAVAVAATLAAGSADAGTNGQQVRLHGPYTEHVRVCGVNQRGDWTCGWWDTPRLDTFVYGWWWRGSIRIRAYSMRWRVLGDYSCWVPADQGPGNDWVTCNVP